MQQEYNNEQSDLMINIDIVLRQLQCAICLNEVENPALTKCGHNFCFNCIDEAVNRHHKCPLCNLELNRADIFINQHLNSIKIHLDEERNKKINKASQEVFGEVNKQFMPEFNVISNMFKKAITEFYQCYESKFIEAVEEYRAKMADINVKFNEKQIQLQQQNQSTEQLRKDHDLQVKELMKSYDLLRDYYVQCVEKTLSTFQCDKNTIDIFTQIHIPTKNVQFKHTFKIQSRLNHIRQALISHFSSIDDPITKINLETLKVCVGRAEDVQNVTKLIQSKQLEQLAQQFNLQNLSTDFILASLGIRQGSIIFIIGDFELKSEEPAKCISYKFEKADKAIDYSSCITCGIHWVCPSCRNECHKGHQIALYKANIVPEWACCYCASKGFCKILNKNSK